MSVIMAKNFDSITKEPLAIIEEYVEYGNNSKNSIGLMAEGGTLTQSYYINSLTDTPFNIESSHLYVDTEHTYSTNIQLFGVSRQEIQTPLGTPKIRFYVCSPTSGDRLHSIVQDSTGTSIVVTHLTLDEFENDFQNSITLFHSDGSGVTALDNFLQSFVTVANVADYTLAGQNVTISYLTLYYRNPANVAERHKIDVLIYAELPFNNINVIDTKTPIGISATDYKE